MTVFVQIQTTKRHVRRNSIRVSSIVKWLMKTLSTLRFKFTVVYYMVETDKISLKMIKTWVGDLS